MEDAEDTVLTWIGTLDGPHAQVGRLQIQHDVLVETTGRAVFSLEDGLPRVETFHEFVTTNHLSAFLPPDRESLTIEGKGNDVIQVYRTLRDHAHRISIAQGQVDFERLSNHVGRFRGAWFSKTAGPVSALGMFGQDVSGSAEWEDASLNSSISSVMFQHIWKGEWRTLMVTQDAGIVVYQDMPADQMLDMVFEVQRDILIPSLEEPDFGRNRGTTRDSARMARVPEGQGSVAD